MEKRKREKNVLAGAAELFDLPADMVRKSFCEGKKMMFIWRRHLTLQKM